MASMNMTVQTPGLANLFSQIGNAGGGANALIEADLNRARRDQIGVSTQLSQADLLAKQRQNESMQQLQQILMDPTLMADPQGRANLMSILSGVPDGLKEGPGFGLGAATFVNPDTFSAGDLSKAAFGTGVQPDYSKTPDGVLAGLMNAMDIANAGNATDITQTQMTQDGLNHRALLPGGGGSTAAAPLVNGGVLKTINEGLAAAIEAQFPGASTDPTLMQSLSTRASEIYQTTRNAQTAVQQAIQESGASVQGQEGWGENLNANPFNLFGIGPEGGTVKGVAPSRGMLPTGGPTVATDATQATGNARAAVAPDGAIPPGAVPPGLRNVQQDTSGKFFITQNGKAIPLQDGQTAVSASDPSKRLVFRGGSWFAL